jgi:hypothetical protein
MRRVRASGPHPLAAVLERTAQVMNHYNLNRALRDVPPGIETHVLRPSPADVGGTLDFGRAETWMEHAYVAAHTYLATELRRQLSAPESPLMAKAVPALPAEPTRESA